MRLLCDRGVSVPRLSGIDRERFPRLTEGLFCLTKTLTMEYGKRPKLPRGLRWDPRSPHICFSWRDVRGRQHQQSTHTNDPAKALAFKQDFQKQKHEFIEERRMRAEDQSRRSVFQTNDSDLHSFSHRTPGISRVAFTRDIT